MPKYEDESRFKLQHLSFLPPALPPPTYFNPELEPSKYVHYLGKIVINKRGWTEESENHMHIRNYKKKDYKNKIN